jgi:hypothetical protein
LAGKLIKIGVISGENLKKSTFLGEIWKKILHFWRENFENIKKILAGKLEKN